uniref:2-oxo acid dehydrogenase subunit E2 n=1 Tax=Sphingomonas bacterium TaxID=1895847 RepID=UPI00157554E6
SRPIGQPCAKCVATPSVIADAGDTDATPLARRLATVKGLSLLGIKGSGARGRIVTADLGLSPLVPAPDVARTATAPAPPTPAPAATVTAIAAAHAPPPVGVPVTTIRLSGMRRTIARRLTHSKQTVPHFYLTARCNLNALLRQRAALNAGLEPRGVKLSVNDLLIKAMALAMVEVPDANVQFGGEDLYRFERVDISMAVAIDGGLVTPTLKDVGALSLSAIAQQSRALAARARDGKLAPEDHGGGTASISNLGMFGIDELFPVINPPQALILGVGAGVEQPWKIAGGIGLATIMSAAASFDHRAIDGAVAARFMAALRGIVEEPLSILC